MDYVTSVSQRKNNSDNVYNSVLKPKYKTYVKTIKKPKEESKSYNEPKNDIIVDENENMDPNQQQYVNENENEYEENNEMMQQQMELNKQIPNEGNYNFKYDGNANQGNEY